MKLLVEEHKTELTLIDNEIQPLNQKILTLKTVTGFSEKDKTLSETHEHPSRETIIKKEKKLNRDRKAFNTNKAYIWPNSQQNKRPRLQPPQPANTNPRNTSFSDSSVSSVSSYSSFSHPPRQTRYQSKRTNELEGHQPPNQRRRSDYEHACGPNNEVTGTDTIYAPAQSSAKSTHNANFLATPNPNHAQPGTIPAHFYKNTHERPKP